LFSNIFSLGSSLDVKDKVSQPYKTAGKSYLKTERKHRKIGKNCNFINFTHHMDG
jgi:hypothetical protein